MPLVDVEQELTVAPTLRPTPVAHLFLGWILILPLIFLAVGGNFSFENPYNETLSRGTSLSGLVSTRSMGIVGYVVIPGIAYAIIMWLLTINLKRVLSLALKMRMLTLLALLTIVSSDLVAKPNTLRLQRAFLPNRHAVCFLSDSQV